MLILLFISFNLDKDVTDEATTSESTPKTGK